MTFVSARKHNLKRKKRAITSVFPVPNALCFSLAVEVNDAIFALNIHVLFLYSLHCGLCPFNNAFGPIIYS